MLVVKEIFGPTIQGEGETAGMPSIFIRFAGCNMWDGRLETRANSKCPYCDTDFLDGNKMPTTSIVDKVKALAKGYGPMLVVLTGGEPLLQNEDLLLELADGLHLEGFAIQIETNGTVNKPRILRDLDYVCCSPKVPKADCSISWSYVDSIKVLYPHPNPDIKPEHFTNLCLELEILAYIQPIDNALSKFNTEASIQKVKELGLPWTLSLQTHKIINQQ